MNIVDKYEEYVAIAEKDPAQLIALIKDTKTTEEELILLAESAGEVLDQDKIVPTLLGLLYHKNPEVREAAVYGIGSFMSETVTDALLDVIAHDENEVVRAAACTSPALEYLLETLDSTAVDGETDGPDQV